MGPSPGSNRGPRAIMLWVNALSANHTTRPPGQLISVSRSIEVKYETANIMCHHGVINQEAHPSYIACTLLTVALYPALECLLLGAFRGSLLCLCQFMNALSTLFRNPLFVFYEAILYSWP